MTRLNETFSELLSEYIKLSLVWDAWINDETNSVANLPPHDAKRLVSVAQELNLRCPPDTLWDVLKI